MDEVLGFWRDIRDRADVISMKDLLDEKLGHETPITYEDWVWDCHYGHLNPSKTRWLYEQELGFIESLKKADLREIAEERIREFTDALKKYII